MHMHIGCARPQLTNDHAWLLHTLKQWHMHAVTRIGECGQQLHRFMLSPHSTVTYCRQARCRACDGCTSALTSASCMHRRYRCGCAVILPTTALTTCDHVTSADRCARRSCGSVRAACRRPSRVPIRGVACAFPIDTRLGLEMLS